MTRKQRETETPTERGRKAEGVPGFYLSLHLLTSSAAIAAAAAAIESQSVAASRPCNINANTFIK